MDVCHLQHSELAKHLHQNRSRAVLWIDNVKDDTGGHTVSPNKEHQPHILQPPKYWTFFPGCLASQEKHIMMFRHMLRSRWVTPSYYWSFRRRNAQQFGSGSSKPSSEKLGWHRWPSVPVGKRNFFCRIAVWNKIGRGVVAWRQGRNTPTSSTFETENIDAMKWLEEKPAQETTYLVEFHVTHDQVYLGCRQCDSATKESDVRIKSDWFAKVTTVDTEAKCKIKKPDCR